MGGRLEGRQAVGGPLGAGVWGCDPGVGQRSEHGCLGLALVHVRGFPAGQGPEENWDMSSPHSRVCEGIIRGHLPQASEASLQVSGLSIS